MIGAMSIPVDLGELEAAARERGPAAYILTVNDRGTPHVVHAEVTITREGLVVQVGERTALYARHRPNVSLLYPCRSAADYSLIVDAVASVVATPGGSRLLLMPTAGGAPSAGARARDGTLFLRGGLRAAVPGGEAVGEG